MVSRSMYQMGMVTLVAAIVWVGVGVYAAITKPVALEIDQSLLEPLPPAIDTEVINQLSSRLKVEGEISEVVSEEVPVATESGSVEGLDEFTN